MELFKKIDPGVREQNSAPHQSFVLLDPSRGATGGCMAGISIYRSEDYPETQRHSSQEGFYVLEGRGYAMVGDKEIPLQPEVAFMVPEGTAHSIRTERNCPRVKVFWFLSR